MERLTHQLRVLGQGVQEPSNWERLGELHMPVLLIAGGLDTKYVDHRPSHGERDRPTRRSRSSTGPGTRATSSSRERVAHELRAWVEAAVCPIALEQVRVGGHARGR